MGRKGQDGTVTNRLEGICTSEPSHDISFSTVHRAVLCWLADAEGTYRLADEEGSDGSAECTEGHDRTDNGCTADGADGGPCGLRSVGCCR